jgi:hypothetical protein
LRHKLQGFHQAVQAEVADWDGLGAHALVENGVPPEGLVAEKRDYRGGALYERREDETQKNDYFGSEAYKSLHAFSRFLRDRRWV